MNSNLLPVVLGRPRMVVTEASTLPQGVYQKEYFPLFNNSWINNTSLFPEVMTGYIRPFNKLLSQNVLNINTFPLGAKLHNSLGKFYIILACYMNPTYHFLQRLCNLALSNHWVCFSAKTASGYHVELNEFY